MDNYLFFISQNYSFEILRPLENVILEKGGQVAWFVDGEDVDSSNFHENEMVLDSIVEVMNFAPIAVFVPGNQVADFIPGLKVQVFHGLEWKKKGHFRIRGFFDLFCTHGAITTDRFNQLAEQHGFFKVIETGWPKLDPLFKTKPLTVATNKTVVLFAPTFSPNLTCAVGSFETIRNIIHKGEYYWLIKFHPKMNPDWIKLYEEIDSPDMQIIYDDSCLPLLQRADVLLSDTSSIISEFLLLDKPVVTVNNSKPGDYLINVTDNEQIEDAIKKALNADEALHQAIHSENQKLHPYQDGMSSTRVFEATQWMLKTKPKMPSRKPINFIKNLKDRINWNYWH